MSLFNKKENKAKSDSLDLFNTKSKSSKKAVIKDTSSKSDKKLSSYYGAGSNEDVFKSDDYFDEDNIFANNKKNKQSKVFDFNWWQYSILIVEGLLIIYTVLVFVGIVPLF